MDEMQPLQKLQEMRARNKRKRRPQDVPAVQAGPKDARATGSVDSVLPRVAAAGEGAGLTYWSCVSYRVTDWCALELKPVVKRCKAFEYEPGSDEYEYQKE